MVMSWRLPTSLSKWPRNRLTRLLAGPQVIFRGIVGSSPWMHLGPADSVLIERAAQRFGTLSLRARGRVAVAISVAFAGQFGAGWVFSIAREHARDRIAL